jgi:hypothetical protein
MTAAATTASNFNKKPKNTTHNGCGLRPNVLLFWHCAQEQALSTSQKPSTVWFPNTAIMVAKTIALWAQKQRLDYAAENKTFLVDFVPH